MATMKERFLRYNSRFADRKSLSLTPQIEKNAARNTEVVLQFLAENDVPPWYRGGSRFQLNAGERLFTALRDDSEQGTTHRVRLCLTLLGLKPLPSENDLRLLMQMSRGNDLAFLWFLMEMHYKTPGNQYCINEQIIFSLIAHLDMVTTLRELDRVLPPGHPSIKVLEQQKFLKEKKDKERRQRTKEAKLRKKKYESPYFEPLPKQRPYGKKLKRVMPNFTAQLSEYNEYLNPNYIVPNESNRWFARYKLRQVNHIDDSVTNVFNIFLNDAKEKIAAGILDGELKEIFEEMKNAKDNDERKEKMIMCEKHMEEHVINEFKRAEKIVKLRDRFLKHMDHEGYKRKIRSQRIRAQLDKEVDAYRTTIRQEEEQSEQTNVQVLTKDSFNELAITDPDRECQYIGPKTVLVYENGCDIKKVRRESKDEEKCPKARDKKGSESEAENFDERLLMKETPYQPDTVLVCTGNNEFKQRKRSATDIDNCSWPLPYNKLRSSQILTENSKNTKDKRNSILREENGIVYPLNNESEKKKKEERKKKRKKDVANSENIDPNDKIIPQNKNFRLYGGTDIERKTEMSKLLIYKMDPPTYYRQSAEEAERRNTSESVGMQHFNQGNRGKTGRIPMNQLNASKNVKEKDRFSSSPIYLRESEKLTYSEIATNWEKNPQIEKAPLIEKSTAMTEAQEAVWGHVKKKVPHPFGKTDGSRIPKRHENIEPQNKIKTQRRTNESQSRISSMQRTPKTSTSERKSELKELDSKENETDENETRHREAIIQSPRCFEKKKKSVTDINKRFRKILGEITNEPTDIRPTSPHVYIKHKTQIEPSKSTEKFFKAPEEHKPYQFDYRKIFEYNYDSDRRKTKYRRLLLDALECDLETVQKDMDNTPDMEDAANKCGTKMWNDELDKQSKKEYEKGEQKLYDCKKIFPANYILPNVPKQDFYDCDDQHLMDTMLNEALKLIAKNPKFVLASMVDAYKLPLLREWIYQRYGKSYTRKNCKDSYNLSLRIFRALEKVAANVPIPKGKDLGKNPTLNYNCLEYVKRKAMRIKKNYRKKLDKSIMDQGRIFWIAMRPYMCHNGPPRNQYFSYMPARIQDINHFRPWKPTEYRDVKKYWEQKMMKKSRRR